MVDPFGEVIDQWNAAEVRIAPGAAVDVGFDGGCPVPVTSARHLCSEARSRTLAFGLCRRHDEC